MCKYSLGQHLMVKNLYSISNSKNLVTEFMTENFTKSKFNVKNVNTVKSSWMKKIKYSKVVEKIKHSNDFKTFKNKSVTKNHWMQNKWLEYKIFELKYGNTKLSNVWKYKKVRLVLAVFASTCLYSISIIMY